MVVMKDGEKLYSRTKSVLKDHLESKACPELGACFPYLVNQGHYSDSEIVKQLEMFLNAFKRAWNDHCIVTKMISDLLMYLVISLECKSLLHVGSNIPAL